MSMARDAQLSELRHECKDIFDRVLYWISDLLDFQNASDRLSIPIGDDNAPHFMNAFYYDEDEAKYLRQFELPNLQTLTVFLRETLEQKAIDGCTELCTSHDLSPILQSAFKVKWGFNKEQKFKKQGKVDKNALKEFKMQKSSVR